MCSPLHVAGAALLINVGSEVARYTAQNRASAANARAARAAREAETRDITLRQIEEGIAASRSIQDVSRQATQSSGLAIAAAADAGVSGGSLQALLGDIEAEEGRARSDIVDQYVVTFDQLERMKEGAFAREASRIAGVPRASAVSTGLMIGGSVTNFLTTRRALNRPKELSDVS